MSLSLDTLARERRTAAPRPGADIAAENSMLHALRKLFDLMGGSSARVMRRVFIKRGIVCRWELNGQPGELIGNWFSESRGFLRGETTIDELCQRLRQRVDARRLLFTGLKPLCAGKDSFAGSSVTSARTKLSARIINKFTRAYCWIIL